MKFNKQIIIILILLSLLLSAIGGAYYFYIENQKTQKINNQVRAVFVASKDIKKDSKISTKDIKQINIAKKYILTTPLLKKEIIGKFASENIYKNDMFRKEKLVKDLVKDKNITRVKAYKFNSYNMNYSMFRNPNYSIKKGDIINIISVYPTINKRSNNSPNSVQYVANQIGVIGFLLNGKEVDESIKKVKVTKIVKKKKVTKTIEQKANEILLDIDSKVLLSLIDDYNRGDQLWMIKTHKKVKKVSKKKEKIKVITKKSINKIPKKKKSYPVKLYKPKDMVSSISATIHYGDEKEAAIIQKKVVKIDMQQQCNNSENYLIGISNKIYLRSGATFKHKIRKIVYRNYIIPYTDTVDKSWFTTCDGLYVHKNEVKIINKQIALKKLAK
jgi:hypothetical protein